MNPSADRLPREVLEMIFSYLPCEDLVESVQFVCTWWQQVSWEKEMWKHIIYNPAARNENVVEMLEKAPQLRILNLESATVDNNLIQFITESCPNLEHLHILWDSIYKCNVTITRPMSQIKILKMSSRTRSRLDFSYLDSAFPNLECLNVVYLRFNVKDLEQYLEKKQDSLHTLGLPCCTEDKLCVLPCLFMCTKLNNLTLSKVCDHIRSWNVCVHLPNISHLTLIGFHMRYQSESLQLLNCFKNITELVLDYCDSSKCFFSAIAYLCLRLQKLKVISYGSSTVEDVFVIANTLHTLHLERLAHLCIHKSFLTDEGIVQVLRKMPQLIHLDLYECQQLTTKCLKLICGFSNLEVLKFDLRNQPLPADLRASDVKNKNLQLMFYNCPDVSYLDAMRQQHFRVHLISIGWLDRPVTVDMTGCSWIKHCYFWCS